MKIIIAFAAIVGIASCADAKPYWATKAQAMLDKMDELVRTDSVSETKLQSACSFIEDDQISDDHKKSLVTAFLIAHSQGKSTLFAFHYGACDAAHVMIKEINLVITQLLKKPIEGNPDYCEPIAMAAASSALRNLLGRLLVVLHRDEVGIEEKKTMLNNAIYFQQLLTMGLLKELAPGETSFGKVKQPQWLSEIIGRIEAYKEELNSFQK